MIVWRNSMYREDGSHIGFEWFGTPEEANAAAEKNIDLFRDRRARVAQCFDAGHKKVDRVRFLNHVADHPDNG